MKRLLCIILLCIYLLVGCTPSVPTETEPPTEISEPVSESIQESEIESETHPETEQELTERYPWIAQIPTSKTERDTFFADLYDYNRKDFEDLWYMRPIPVKFSSDILFVGMTLENVDMLTPSFCRVRHRGVRGVYSGIPLAYFIIDEDLRYCILEFDLSGIVTKITTYEYGELPEDATWKDCEPLPTGLSMYETIEMVGFPYMAVHPSIDDDYSFTKDHVTFIWFDNNYKLVNLAWNAASNEEASKNAQNPPEEGATNTEETEAASSPVEISPSDSVTNESTTDPIPEPES